MSYKRAYCPQCDMQVALENRNSEYSCSTCNLTLARPECLTKDAYDLVSEINEKKEIPIYGYLIIIILAILAVLEILIYSIPIIRSYKLFELFNK